jgi:hypothetical protein
MGLKLIGSQLIKTKRRIQWDRSQIRAIKKGLGPPKKMT